MVKDYTQIAYIGVEADNVHTTVYDMAGCRLGTLDFYAIDKKGILWADHKMRKYPDFKFIIDANHDNLKDDENMEDYCDRMVKWCLSNRPNIEFVTAFSTTHNLSAQEAERLNKAYFRPLESQGVRVCYPQDPEQGIDYWIQACRDHGLVSLPGDLDADKYQQLFQSAMINGTQVYGQSVGKPSLITSLPFAYVSTLSWKSGGMYGATYTFEGTELKSHRKEEKDNVRRKHRAEYMEAGIDIGLLDQDKPKQVDEVNCLAWGKFQNFLSDKKSGEYWSKRNAKIINLGAIGMLTSKEIKDFLLEHNCAIEVTTDEQAQGQLTIVNAYLERDQEAIDQISDSTAEAFASSIGAEAEVPGRRELDSAIRQTLYTMFYTIAPARPKPRSDEDMVPNKVLMTRAGEPEPFDNGEGVLPEAAGTEGLNRPTSTLDSSAGGDKVRAMLDSQVLTDEPSDLGTSEGTQPIDYTGFADFIPDRLQKAKALLAFELLFEQLKLKHEKDLLKAERAKRRIQRQLSQKINKIAQEVGEAFDSLTPEIINAIEEAAQDAFNGWRIEADPELIQELADHKAKYANRPQNKLTPAQASAMGRKGGAPIGNQNNRKKGLMSTKFPVVNCDNCFHKTACPEYKPSHTCAFNNEIESPITLTEGVSPEIAAQELILGEQIKRIRRALLSENLMGGEPLKSVTKLMKDTSELASRIHRDKHLAQKRVPKDEEDKKEGDFLADLLLDKPVKEAEYDSPPTK